MHMVSSLISSSLFPFTSSSSSSLFSTLLPLLEFNDVQNNPEFYNSILHLLNRVLTYIITHSQTFPPSFTSIQNHPSYSPSPSSISENTIHYDRYSGYSSVFKGEENNEQKPKQEQEDSGYFIRSTLVYLSKRLSVRNNHTL